LFDLVAKIVYITSYLILRYERLLVTIYKKEHPMFKSCFKIVLISLIAFILTGCATTQDTVPAANPLRIGITPEYPPIIFRQGGNITGFEADMARMLGEELKRPVNFVILRWDEQISALLNEKIDIIMSGMSITKAREVRIRFTDYYLKSGLLAAMRTEDAKKYISLDSMLQSSSAVGSVKDTTGDAFVQENFPHALRKARLSKANDGAVELKRRSIDIFIHDAPSMIWIVSENEADITALWDPFNEEYYAWAIRKDDDQFFKQVNDILKRWKQDGTLRKVLNKWLPAHYMKRYD
jgi:ABC-type amino acid transport substrate-binding protein